MQAALIVIDVQVGILENAYRRDETISMIKQAIEKARAAKIPVIWIQHSDDEIVRGSEPWKIVSELEPSPSEIVIDKHYRSAFVKTELEGLLKDLRVQHLYLCGAETNYCVRHTSHSALEIGYDITLIEDAHTCSSFDWDGYQVDAAKVIDEQNTNLMNYKLPGRTAKVVPMSQLSFA
jgi:nicotinamidase-related amidase